MNWSCLVMKRAFTKSSSPPTALTSTEPAMSNNVPRFLHNIPIGLLSIETRLVRLSIYNMVLVQNI